MLNKVPNFLYKLLLAQYGENITNNIIKGYLEKRPVTLRVNTLKTNIHNIKKVLDMYNIKYKEVKWYKDALIIEDADENKIRELSIYNNGEIYLQSLSSMLPPIILSPKENENILDMAAAPGGKTTQVSALSKGKALITACEKNKIRSERLRYNIDKQGANGINVLVEDARKLNSFLLFDKILLDAPCSGSGTIYLNNEKLEKYFKEELIERSSSLQFQLLKKAIQILKPGHEMIYSTCSILKQENEDNLSKILRNGEVEIVPISKEIFQDIPMLKVEIEGTICVCPSKLYEGFFIAKLRKK